MTDLNESLTALHRPRLLIRAARHGAAEYSRTRDLRRVLRTDTAPRPSRALPRLMDMEAQHEARRQAGDAAYSIVRHVEILIALMAEARLFRRGGFA